MKTHCVVLMAAMALSGCDWQAAEGHARCVASPERCDAGSDVDAGGRDAGIDDAGRPDAGPKDAGTSVASWVVNGLEPVALFQKGASELWVITREGRDGFASVLRDDMLMPANPMGGLSAVYANAELNEDLLVAQLDGGAFLLKSTLGSATTRLPLVGPGFPSSIASMFTSADGGQQASYWVTTAFYFQAVGAIGGMPTLLSDASCTDATLTDIEVVSARQGGGAVIGTQNSGAECIGELSYGIRAGGGFQTITRDGQRDGGQLGDAVFNVRVGAGTSSAQVIGQFDGGFRWQPLGDSFKDTQVSGSLALGDVSYGVVSAVLDGTVTFANGQRFEAVASRSLMLLDMNEPSASLFPALGVVPQKVMPVLVMRGAVYVLYKDNAGQVTLTRVPR